MAGVRVLLSGGVVDGGGVVVVCGSVVAHEVVAGAHGVAGVVHHFVFSGGGGLHALVVCFFLWRFGEPSSITRLKEYQNQDIAGTSTALVFPVYNENAVRVLEGLRAT
jgi:hypothetical protein